MAENKNNNDNKIVVEISSKISSDEIFTKKRDGLQNERPIPPIVKPEE